MSSKHQKLQHFIERYRRETGKVDIDMHDVAKFAIANGYKPPTPPDPATILARDFSDAARQQTRSDDQTGKPYRVWHAYSQRQGDRQLTLWIDIDEAPRNKMWMSLQKRREQMVGDGVQLTLDADHWNRKHHADEPIAVPMDFTEDVEWRKNAPDDDEEVA
jgi:hypothetical protein